MPTTTVTVSPDFFDLHYWFFGILVMLAITALLDGMLVTKTNATIGSDTFILTTLIGMFIGSIISLLMNIVPWETTVATFGTLVLYLWRGRQ